MNVKKIYANDNEQGTLVCEQCGKTKVINVSAFKNIGRPLKVKCGCGHVFFISIEVRECHGKQTRLAGAYVKFGEDISQGLEKGNMMVEGLSKTGLGFRTQRQHTLCAEDVICVRFHLDDEQHSEVRKIAVVKWIDDHVVDAVFLDFDAYNKTNRTLDSYLLPR